MASVLSREAEHSKHKHDHEEALRVSASACLMSEEKTQRAGPKLLLGVLGTDGHQGTAILGTSSLTCREAVTSLTRMGGVGGDVPRACGSLAGKGGCRHVSY